MTARLASWCSIVVWLAACTSTTTETTCSSSTTLCGGACVDLATSASDCGACGNPCAAGESCVAGSCSCEPPNAVCGGACVALDTAANCGACGATCAAPAACEAGTCVCSAPFTDCSGACVPLASDVDNCGACGHACAPGDACFSGVCGPATCTSAAPDRCGAACVDLRTDPLHCGSCATACADPALPHCVAGACSAACPPFQTDCPDACANLRTDPANCGACGVACVAGRVCSDGACVLPCGGTLRFPGAASQITAGDRYPRTAGLADLDGDGLPDLVVGDSYGAVSVARGLAGGWFAAPASYAVAGGVDRIAVADLDGLGGPDVAVATTYDGLAILLNAGDGTLLPPVTYEAGAYLDDVAAADLDADGDLDLAALDSAGAVDVLLNSGYGTFTGPVAYALSAGNTSATELAVGDVTGDGRPDLVVGGSDVISVHAGTGGGAFAAPVDHDTYPDSTPDLSLADMDGDGRLDVVFTGWGGFETTRGRAFIRWNAATNPFSTQTWVEVVGMDTDAAIAADVDGDGALDLVATDNRRRDVAVFLNVGGRTFAPPIEVQAHTSTQFLAAAPLDGDAGVDLLALSNGVAEVFPGLGAGAFDAPARIWPPSLDGAWPFTPEDPYRLELGDLDADGALDLAIASYNQFRLDLAPGTGDGTFGSWIGWEGNYYVHDLRIADLNGDGWLDVVYLQTDYGTGAALRALVNDGAGGFAQTAPLYVNATLLAVGDVTEDGIPDVVTGMSGSSIYILAGVGDGTFQPPVGLSYWPQITDKIAVADLNGDGRGDIVQTSFSSGNNILSVFRNKGGATLTERFTFSLNATYATVGYPQDLAISDVDGDGRPDAVVLDDGIGVYRNTGTALQGRVSSAFTGGALRMSDLNGDRKADAIVATAAGVRVALGTGTGSFSAPVLYPAGASRSLAVGDVDGDGRPDVLTPNTYGVSGSGEDLSVLTAQCR